ncbi:hypothetical protein DCC39_08215 [Pueribacillus theae]|uniref:Uncharacterized protein n=1 Tax=Pueribacillus theae TaxID=2171751 RepID=A0A2U1K4D9_9BACI|nr:hypothetical protein [Pueribacillus theae]PWA12054.1 hypothetical protein DCC39_08215 [Pueribacillus theae]
MKKALIPCIAILMQLIYFSLFLSAAVAKMDPIIAAMITLLLAIASLQLGVYSFARNLYPILSLIVVIIAWLMIFFFLFAFMLPEAGIPPYLCDPFIKNS